MILKVKILHSYWEKSIGLIGADPITPVYFTTRWGIHTCGMKLPIDVLILDDSLRVVKFTEKLLPNRLFFWNPKYFRVVELPAEEIEKHSIKIGDTITLTQTVTKPDA